MTRRTEIDVRDIVRVIFSGMAAYITVDAFVLPWLVASGIAFPSYLYLGLGVTVVLSTGICLLLRPRTAALKTPEKLHPAE